MQCPRSGLNVGCSYGPHGSTAIHSGAQDDNQLIISFGVEHVDQHVFRAEKRA
jgi:hypothetical protein